MNKAILQYWEESERGWGTRPDGASIHLDQISHSMYLDQVYTSRETKNVPDEYDRVIGGPILVSVSDSIFDTIKIDKNIRLQQYELNNLIKLEEIILND